MCDGVYHTCRKWFHEAGTGTVVVVLLSCEAAQPLPALPSDCEGGRGGA